MSEIKALIITGNGTNCDIEMAHACRLAGARADIAHISDILSGKVAIPDYQFLNLPGGFLDGDDLGSAQVQSVRLHHARVTGSGNTLLEEIRALFDNGGVILGICNGFQSLVKTGLLPGNPYGTRRVSLSFNDSAKYEDRWVNLTVDPDSPCVFTTGLDSLYVPVRHGEGKFITDNEDTLREIQDGHLACLRYADENGNPTMTYPANPNGSIDSIAGICDATGRIFGLMPHPEAYTHRTNHPRWTREADLPERGAGMALFDNAVTYLKNNL